MAVLSIAAGSAFWVRPVSAGWTTPELLLTGAAAASGPDDVFLQLTGSFHEEDLVQIPYPLQVLIRNLASGDVYARYSLPAGVFTGRYAPLSDGLQADDATALLSLGDSSRDGRLLMVGQERIRLLLPSSFPSGEAEVQLFAVSFPGVMVVSNPLSVTIPAPEGQ